MLLALVLVWARCHSTESHDGTSKELDQVRHEVAVIHDTAMARMGRMMQLQKALAPRLDTIASLDASRAQEVQDAIRQLAAADEAMRGWMRTLRVPLTEEAATLHQGHGMASDTMGVAEQVKYLREAKANMQAIDKQMRQAIRSAEQQLD
ncbi:hypothetical protein SAMN05421823_1243 [Catalinimonas alkaloidigena]|uniref:Uncharacterized protein n=1 Tax=Catalinimonas alkaloidigena TaxID=1075417 RepID=A0A1G9VTN3_9BACT|nr:hypothetical protein [Catalinimonas alkaloidigena]SDM75530.1 hypothetical protein SAMN05421823_1243 [Catalinimonas alkaloidigena]